MLQIISNGTALDLPTDISINLTIENPFMVEDRVPTPHSLTFELPPTANNLQLFGFPNRHAGYTNLGTPRSIPCSIMFQGLNIAKGALVLQSFDEAIKVNFSGVDFNTTLKSKMFDLPLDTVTLTGTYSNIQWTTPGNYANRYREWAKSKAYGSDDRFILAPIGRKRDTPFSWWGRKTSGSGTNLRVVVANQLQNISYNSFNPTTQEFFFTDGTNNAHAPMLPQLRIGYLFDYIMPHLPENPFKSGDFYNIVVPTYWHPNIRFVGVNAPLIENLSPPAYIFPDGTPYIRLGNFLPNVDANVFIKEILKLFCYTLYYKRDEFRIASNSDILQQPCDTDWTEKMMGAATLLETQGKFYEYGYSDERPVFDENETPVTVDTINDMIAYPYTMVDGSYEDLFYIEETKQYFLKRCYLKPYKDSSGIDKNETIEDFELQGYRIESIAEDEENRDKFSVKSDIKQMDVYPTVFFDSLNNLMTSIKYQYALPVHEPGSDTQAQNLRTKIIKRETNFNLLMYSGPREVGSSVGGVFYDYPYLSPYGNENLSFEWDGPNGLLEKFHNPFKAWVEKPKLKLSAQMLLNALDYHQLDITEKIHIDGRNYFIEKIQFTIRPNKIEPAQIDFVDV